MGKTADRSGPLSPCPCGLAAAYAGCCGRWHAGPLQLQAGDAVALMRSRYSAFVLGLDDYLLQTWHPDTRPPPSRLTDPATRWLGLEVKRFEQNGADHATVEFVARSKHGGRASHLHERSRFVREGGRWFYLDGEVS